MLRKAAVLTALLATTIAVAACGGTSPSSGNNNKTASKLGTRANIGLRLARCMRSHGVPDYPDPSSGGGFQVNQTGSSNGSSSVVINGHALNVSGPAFRNAMNRCSKLMPQGPPISGAQLAEIKQGALKMAACMRAHGVPNFADPQVTTGPGGHGIAVRLGAGSVSGGKVKGTPPSPAFQHAMSVCQSYMQFGPKSQKAVK